MTVYRDVSILDKTHTIKNVPHELISNEYVRTLQTEKRIAKLFKQMKEENGKRGGKVGTIIDYHVT